MTLRWREHPDATHELLAAIRHYHQQQPGLGDDFDAQVVAAIHDLCEWPDSWPPVPGWNREPPLRSRQVAIFPYRVVYFVEQEEAVIVAYAHTSRARWSGKLAGVSSQATVTLSATSPEDFATLRSLFDQPAFLGWGGTGRRSDAEIRRKYLGSRYPAVECFLVVLAGRAVGLVQLHVADDGDGGGMDLILVPEVRGRGVGREVVAEMVRRAHAERGWTRLTVDPDVANEDGIRFWRAVGFEPERTVTDQPGGAPYVLMAWPLQDQPTL